MFCKQKYAQNAGLCLLFLRFIDGLGQKLAEKCKKQKAIIEKDWNCTCWSNAPKEF